LGEQKKANKMNNEKTIKTTFNLFLVWFGFVTGSGVSRLAFALDLNYLLTAVFTVIFFAGACFLLHFIFRKTVSEKRRKILMVSPLILGFVVLIITFLLRRLLSA